MLKYPFKIIFFKKALSVDQKNVLKKPRVWCTQFTSCSLVGIRNISPFFLFIFKATKIMTNNLMFFQYFLIFKTAIVLSFFIEKYYSSPTFTYKSSKKKKISFFKTYLKIFSSCKQHNLIKVLIYSAYYFWYLNFCSQYLFTTGAMRFNCLLYKVKSDHNRPISF